jgi:hypothetical protein
MRYKVSFRKRFNAEGEPADRPIEAVSFPEGVVQEALIVEQEEPPAIHSQGVMDEDDSFLSLGIEAWEFEVTPGREEEFLHAIRNSERALAYQEIDEAA